MNWVLQKWGLPPVYSCTPGEGADRNLANQEECSGSFYHFYALSQCFRATFRSWKGYLDPRFRQFFSVLYSSVLPKCFDRLSFQ